jgi:hypothetical protein
MATWPRTIMPARATLPEWPAPLISRSATGKVQTRATTAIGRRWSEEYSALSLADSSVLGFLAFINNCWSRGTAFDIVHPLLETPKGTIGGTPRVNGGSQTGSALTIDGATTGVTNWLRAGDVISIAGLVQVFDVLSNVNSDGSGNVVLTLNPPIFDGNSPADNALLTLSGVLFRAILADPPVIPPAGPDRFFSGMRLSFMEAP